jgi:hypothetical protein
MLAYSCNIVNECKFLDIDQIPAQLIEAGVETLHSEINLLILFGKRKNCLGSGGSVLLYSFMGKVTNMTVIVTEESAAYKILSNIIL